MPQPATREAPSITRPAPVPHKARDGDSPRWRAAAGWLVGAVPTIAVLTVLAGLFYWGNHTGWKIPAFSEVAGASKPASDDWCTEHGVAESICVECNLDDYPRPTDYGWCREHGVHNCVLDHPDVAQLKQTPEIDPADLERAARALALTPRPENSFACPNYRNRIQFASHDAALQAGVDVEPVFRGSIEESIEAVGEIRYDQTRVARLSSKSPGTIWRVDKQVGDPVKEDEVLALVDAARVGEAKAELLTALAEQNLAKRNHDRIESLAAKGIVRGKDVLEAETLLSQAKTRVLGARQSLINLGLPASIDEYRGLEEERLASKLQFLGLPDELKAALDPAETTSNLLPVRSPLEGVVVARETVAGEVVDPAKTLFEVVDQSRMWLILNVNLEDARYLEVGREVHFQPDGGGESVSGNITWISTAADRKTRTIQVRAELPNPSGRLRDETFGSGRIVLRRESDAIVVPNNALTWDGSCHILFVRDKHYFEDDAPKVFHTRSVRPGAKMEDVVEIIAGVLPGEIVATEGSDVLKSQLLKNNLGAG